MHVLFTLALAAAPPSPDALGDAIAAEASERLGDRCVHDAAQASITCAENATVLSLANLHLEYRKADSSERAGLFETWVQHLAAPPAAGDLSPAAIRERLRPLVKPATEVRLLELETRIRGKTVAVIEAPLTDSLRLVLAIDSPTSMELASPDLLKAASLSVSEATAIARTNVELTPGAIQEVGAGVWVSASGDGYDCARMLSPKRLKNLGVRGQPVVLLLARDRAFATSLDDAVGMTFLLGAAVASMKEELVRPISIVPVVYDGDNWVDLQLPVGHPARADLENLRGMQRGQWYHEQHDLRTALYAKTGEQVFVSKLSGFRGPAGLSFLATLEKGTTLLPVANHVTLVSDDESIHLVPWDAFLAAAGSRVRPEPASAPPLFRADGAAIYADLTAFSKVWLDPADVFGPKKPRE